jgi:hypothetical protein
MTTVKLSFLVFALLAADPPNPPPPALVVLLLDFERLNISCLLPRKQQIGKEGSFVFPQAL